MLEKYVPEKIARLADQRDAADPNHTQLWLVLGAILFLIALLFIWAAYVRKPKQKSTTDSFSVPDKSATISRNLRRDGRRRQRRRRWKNRNPTLAQTGGLPPRKDSDSSQ